MQLDWLACVNQSCPPIPSLQGQDLLLQLPGSGAEYLLCLDDLSAM